MAAKVTLLALAVVLTGFATERAPQDGRALLERMRAAYLGKWFKTVTFVQQTTQTRKGVTDTSTWYEALKSPDRLRIDFGDPKDGNGVLYTADSLYAVRGGKITRTAASGNPFLPFVAGVYDQTIETTLRQISAYKFDLSKLYTTTWEGRATEVAGSQSASDTTSPQFWVDRERLIVVRMIVPLNPATPTDVADGGGRLARGAGRDHARRPGHSEGAVQRLARQRRVARRVLCGCEVERRAALAPLNG